MALKSLLESWDHRKSITILPELRTKMLCDIRDRYRSDIRPEKWRLYFGEDPNCEFPEACLDIIHDVVEKSMKVSETVRSHIVEMLFDESQSFWYEISEDFKYRIDFIDKLVNDAVMEIEKYFPGSSHVFGESATQLLIDLAFQNNVNSYTRPTKSDFADTKRMINFCGQIIEDIFCKKIFLKPMTIGEIYRELNEHTKTGGTQREIYFKQIPYAKDLLDKYFLERMKLVAKLRNNYSHGTEIPTDPVNDLYNCIKSLFEDHYGILNVLYRSLNNK